MQADPILDSLNPRINALQETGIVEVAVHGWGRDGLIPLWFGEGDVPTPGFICEAAAAALRAGDTFYTAQRGIDSLREAIRDHNNRLYGIDLDLERVSLTQSGMNALFTAMQMLVRPGDEVLVVGPVWPNIYSTVLVHGGTATHAAIRLGADGWRLDLDELFAQVTDRTRAIFINSPGNPTGWIMESDEMRRLLEFARARGIWLISDEVYNQLVYDREVAPSLLTLAEPEDRVLVVNSLSKSWLMTGWRLGWLVHPPALGDTIAKLVQINTSGSPPFLQAAAVTAIRDGEHVIRALRERCRAGRDLVYDRLGAWPRVRAVRPSGAFYAFFAIDGVSDSLELCKSLIDRCNVGLAPGSAFGPAGEGYVRLCYAATPETLGAAMDRLETVLGEGNRQRGAAAD